MHVLLAAATAAVVWPVLRCGLLLHDVGELFWFVDALAGGGVPGVDHAVSGYGPGRYLLVWGLFELFGERLVVVRALLLAVWLAAAAMAWELARRYLPAGRAWLPVACLLLAPGPLHKGFFVAGTLALALALLAFSRRPDGRTALGFGAVLAAVGVLRLDLGAFGGLAFAAVLLATPGRARTASLALAAAPGVVVLGLLALWTAFQGSGALEGSAASVLADAWANQQIGHPSFPGPRALLAPGSLDAWLLWLPLPVYGVLACLAINERRHGRPALHLGILLGLGVISLNQVRMKPEYGHLLQAGPLLWLAAAVVASRLKRGGALLSCLVPVALLAATLGPHRGDPYTGSFTIPWERDVVLETRLGPARLDAEEAAEIGGILRWLDSQPPGALWVPTYQPLLYALSGRRDVTGFPSLLQYGRSPRARALVLRRLEAARPGLAVFVDDTPEGPEMRLPATAPELHDYLLSHYVEAGRAGRAVLMVAR